MIKTEKLCKQFEDKKRGVVKAVNNVSFHVEAGEIFGLLGTNGAGKTTTLRMISTILKPSAGKATVVGYDVVEEPERVREGIGYLTGDTNLYERLTPREVLKYYANLFGMDNGEIGNRIEELSERFDLKEFVDTKIGKLSTGQRQRTSICRAIVQNPKLMIFDEPTAGLDPISARHITEFIRESKREGSTLLFSTHYLREAEKLCDRIAIMHNGEIPLVGTLDEILEKTNTDDLEDAFFALVDGKIEIESPGLD